MVLKFTAKGTPYYDDLTDEKIAFFEEHAYSDEILTPTIMMRWRRLGEKRSDAPLPAKQTDAKDETDQT